MFEQTTIGPANNKKRQNIIIHQLRDVSRLSDIERICLRPTTKSQTVLLTTERKPSLDERKVGGSIFTTISLPKSYYTPGESISFMITIENHTSTKIMEVLVDLVSIEKYTGRGENGSKATKKETVHMVHITRT